MQIVNYNSGIWVITVDGLMLGRTMGDYTNLFAVTSFRYKNIEGGLHPITVCNII
jgi:hypothetical protein